MKNGLQLEENYSAAASGLGIGAHRQSKLPEHNSVCVCSLEHSSNLGNRIGRFNCQQPLPTYPGLIQSP